VREFIDVNGNNILVKEKDLARVEEKLKELGYVVEEK